MWKSLITILCASGTVLAYNEPQSILAQAPPRNRTRIGRPINVKRYSCPDGFVRLRQNCFYFSAGKANWQEAHFFCADRNSTLAELPRKKMDTILRKFLSGPQMNQWERWIGARYNFGSKIWEWGISGGKISYDGFSKLRSDREEVHKWFCAAMNPKRRFRWAVRDCFEEKHYVCRTPAAQIKCDVNKQLVCPPRTGKVPKKSPGKGGRRKRIKPFSNRNDTSTRNMIEKNEIAPAPYSQGPWRTVRRSRPMWGNGMKLGMRPPVVHNTRWAPGAKYSDRLQLVKGKDPTEPDQWVSAPKVATISGNRVDSEPVKESSTESVKGGFWPGPKTLSAGTNNMLSDFEEILFKN